jgi:hypothetical protein
MHIPLPKWPKNKSCNRLLLGLHCSRPEKSESPLPCFCGSNRSALREIVNSKIRPTHHVSRCVLISCPGLRSSARKTSPSRNVAVSPLRCPRENEAPAEQASPDNSQSPPHFPRNRSVKTPRHNHRRHNKKQPRPQMTNTRHCKTLGRPNHSPRLHLHPRTNTFARRPHIQGES